MLRCSTLPALLPPATGRKAQQAVASDAGGSVKRRPLDEEEPCPICYEDMASADPDALVWCKHGCGKNVHGKCMR